MRSLEELGRFAGRPDLPKTKAALAAAVRSHLGLETPTRSKSLCIGPHLVVKVLDAGGTPAGIRPPNAILSLRTLAKYDDRPVVAAAVRPSAIDWFCINSSFISRASHSSHRLSSECVRGTFLGTDVATEVAMVDADGSCRVTNTAVNLARLFEWHVRSTWKENLTRIVEATQSATTVHRPFKLTEDELLALRDNLSGPARHALLSRYASARTHLDGCVRAIAEDILDAASATSDPKGRGDRVESLVVAACSEVEGISGASGGHSLEDLRYDADGAALLIDVKVKVVGQDSNPKGWNVEKFLRALGQPARDLAFLIVGVDLAARRLTTALVPVLDHRLIARARVSQLWSARGSLGTTQLDGRSLLEVLRDPAPRYDASRAEAYVTALWPSGKGA